MSFKEQRRGPRVPIELFVDERREGELYFQRTANISKGGMYFENTIPHPVGTKISVEFTLPGESEKFKLKAEVVSASIDPDQPGMGLKFVGLDGSQTQKIDAFVDKLVEKGAK